MKPGRVVTRAKGERISVYWPLDRRCYAGTIAEVDSKDEAWLLVKYDEPQPDGSDAVFWAWLDEGRWQCRWVFAKHDKVTACQICGCNGLAYPRL